MRSPARIALVALLAAPASAQAVLYQWPATGQIRPGAAGDVDADGYTDLAVGLPDLGLVRVYSGQTGLKIRQLSGAATGDRFGWELISPGDVDGDGRPDLAVAANGNGVGQDPYLRLFSGAGGSVLWHVEVPSVPNAYWSAPAVLADRDGDGLRDLVIGQYGPAGSGPGSVQVFSGATGAPLLRIDGAPGTDELHASAVDTAGDVDGDGVADLLVGDPLFDNMRGRALLYSGSDASLIRTFDAPALAEGFGRDVASVEDVDGDGVREIFIAAPGEPVGTGETGRVRLYSGSDATLLLTIDGEDSPGISGGFGGNLDSVSDLDGDGLRDLFLTAGVYRVGCCGYYPAEARVYSSVSGEILYLGSGDSWGGARTVVTPDLDGDGVEEYLFGGYDYWDQVPIVGLTLVGPAGASYWDWLCTPKDTSTGSTPLIHHRGFPSLSLGQGLTLEAHNLPPGTTGFFAWSRTLEVRPFAGATLCLGGPIHRLPVLSAPNGSMSLQLSPGRLAILGLVPGDAFLAQAWFRDSGFAPPEDMGLTTMVMFPVLP